MPVPTPLIAANAQAPAAAGELRFPVLARAIRLRAARKTAWQSTRQSIPGLDPRHPVAPSEIRVAAGAESSAWRTPWRPFLASPADSLLPEPQELRCSACVPFAVPLAIHSSNCRLTSPSTAGHAVLSSDSRGSTSQNDPSASVLYSGRANRCSSSRARVPAT